MMAPTLELQFLSLFLLFLMNGHVIGARDMKLEYKATSVSNDESYGEGYITSESAKPNYIASYSATKHNHNHEKLRQVYVEGYRSDTHDSNTPYIAAYKSTTHDSNTPYVARYRSSTHDSNTPYEAGYMSNTHDSNTPYIAAYKSSTHDSNTPYIAGYRSSTHDSNTPYVGGYRSNTHDSNTPYIAGYKSNTHDSNTPYIVGYTTTNSAKKDKKESSHDHDGTTKPYITQYGGDTSPKEYPKESSHNHDHTTKPYITQYGDDTSPKEYPKVSSHNHGHTTKPYIIQYGDDINPKEYPKVSSHNHGHTTKRYITQYGDDTSPKEYPKVSSHNHDHTTKAYITQYSDDISSKKYPKESLHDHDGTTATEPYITQYGEIGAPIKESSNVDHTEAFKTGFFGLDDLYVGNVMTLQFPIQEVSHYLPRKEAESIPFSISQLPSVLQLLSISEDSSEANAMRDTLGQCEAEPITGETKICATSLESMLEFVGTIIGSETKHNILTTTTTGSGGVPLKKLKILEVSEDMNAPKWVACHPLPYPYAVYYCHFIATGSKVFKVSLGSENGDDDKIEALGICHLDTSDWNPNHIIFTQLGIKPGKDAVCHFFPTKHLMWLPQHLQATM